MGRALARATECVRAATNGVRWRMNTACRHCFPWFVCPHSSSLAFPPCSPHMHVRARALVVCVCVSACELLQSEEPTQGFCAPPATPSTIILHLLHFPFAFQDFASNSTSTSSTPSPDPHSPVHLPPAVTEPVTQFGQPAQLHCVSLPLLFLLCCVFLVFFAL